LTLNGRLEKLTLLGAVGTAEKCQDRTLVVRQIHTSFCAVRSPRALAQHCTKRDLLDNDPTLGIKLRRMTGDGHHTWTEDEIAAFEAHHSVGSRERLALALGLYTAQRRGDVVRMGRQHVRNGPLHVTQQKTGKPLRDPAASRVEAGP
jgi:integrase